jgi:Copper chaperone
MEREILNVNGMSCSHCEKTVINALTELGASEVLVDLGAKTVTVSYDSNKLPLDRIKAEIEEIGYELA